MPSPGRSLDRQGTEGFALLHVNQDELEDVILEHGQGAELRRAVRCPCARPETGQPSVSCLGCRGLGYFYPESMREPVVVLLHSRNPKREDQAAGSRVRGDAQATFTLGVIPAAGDLVLPEAEVHTVHQLLQRAYNPVRPETLRDRLDDGVTLPDLGPAEDRLVYPSVAMIEAVAWKPSTGVPVVGREGTDFDLTDGNRITWRPGRGPEGGASFSVRYRAPAVYVVEYDPSAYRAEAGTRYPYKATVHRLDSWNASRNLR